VNVPPVRRVEIAAVLVLVVQVLCPNVDERKGEQDAGQRGMLEVEPIVTAEEPLVSTRDVRRLVEGLGKDEVRGCDPDQAEQDDRCGGEQEAAWRDDGRS